MFHIKDDKRSKKSARLIVNGLYQCLEHKKFQDITITDIQKASTVGRATFYRLFDNLTDVLEYEWNSIFDEMLQNYEKEAAGSRAKSHYEALFSYLVSYWAQNPVLTDALKDSGRMDIFYHVFKNHAPKIGEILCPDETLSERDLEYFAALASSAFFGMFSTWITRKQTETKEELLAILSGSVLLAARSLDHD